MSKRSREASIQVKLRFMRSADDDLVGEWCGSEEKMRTLFSKDSWLVKLLDDKMPSADKFKKLFEHQTVGTSLKKLTKNDGKADEDVTTEVPVTVDEHYPDHVIHHVINQLNGYKDRMEEVPLAESEIINAILLAEYLGMAYEKL